MNKRVLRYLELAKKEALKSNSLVHRHGAVIVKGNYIVSKGHNQIKSHPIQKKYDALRTERIYLNNSIHAEIDALIKSGDIDLTDCEIFLYRVTKGNNQGISRPCKACMQAIKDSGIKYIYYSTTDKIDFLELE